MTLSIQVWTCCAFHPAYRCGGWASVRSANGLITGFAGGERNTTGARLALAGLAAALRDLPTTAKAAGEDSIIVHSASPELAAFAATLAGIGRQAPAVPPEDDLDLWARIITAAAGRRLNFVHGTAGPDTPLAFSTAWAELARDKAKAAGPFTAAIPKSNLMKVRGFAPH